VLGGLWDGPTAGGLLRGITAEPVQGLLLYFERQRTVSVTLEAVLFLDGTTVGPDSGNWVAKWKAYFDAERDVFEAATNPGPEGLALRLRPWSENALFRAKPYFQRASSGSSSSNSQRSGSRRVTRMHTFF